MCSLQLFIPVHNNAPHTQPTSDTV